jgi:hypothetical protein
MTPREAKYTKAILLVLCLAIIAYMFYDMQDLLTTN